MYSNDGACAGRTLSASYFASVNDTRPQPFTVEWPATFEAFEEVGADGKEHVPLWSPATFLHERRAAANVETLSALVLDYDGDFDPAELMSVWSEYEHVLHSTYTPGSYRIIIPYDRPVTAAEHPAIWAWAKRKDARIDGACKDAARMYFLPTCRTDLDVPPRYGYHSGARLVVDRLPVDLRPGPANRAPPLSSTPRAPAVHTGTGTVSGGSAYEGIQAGEQKYDLALIEERCAFMAHVRADAASLPEPEWYAGLSILARCRNGDTLAHEVSRPYPGYNQWETEAKYLRAKSVGPARCDHIRTLSTACANCPLSVTSPVLLGRNEQRIETESDPQELLREAREVYARARADEDSAKVELERAKRTLRAVRAPRSGSSEEEIEAAVRGLSDAEEARRIAERIRVVADKALKKAQGRVSMTGLPPGADPGVWGRLTIGKDKPASSVANCMLILGEDPKWSSRLSYDSFSVEVCLDREPLAEERATEITAQLGYDYAIELSTAMVVECIRAVARRRSFHPVQDYLRTLSWDGKPRLHDLAFRGFGAMEDVRDPELVTLLVERFMLSLLARTFKPGAKVDTMLVLVGAQGAKKSTSLETLVGEQWFGSTKLDLANKDSFLQLRGKWLYEIGEMEGIKRADANVSKQWLSNRVDTYRAPYARRAEDHPRQTVMAGSTNENEILLDPTGFRRYWIVPVRSADVPWIEANRDQLWAEALALRAQGRQWWFDEGSEESERLRIHTMPYQQIHPWTEVIYEWVLKRQKEDPFTAGQVLREALGQMVTNLTQSEATIVGTILRHYIGCTAERVADGARRPTMYRRPAWMAKTESADKKVLPMRLT